MQIAVEKFSEATVGYRKNKEMAAKWVQLFNTPYFMVSAVSEIFELITEFQKENPLPKCRINRCKMSKELNFVER